MRKTTSERFLRTAFDNLSLAANGLRGRYRDAFESFARQRINSYRQLISRYPTLRPAEKVVALNLLAARAYHPSLHLLLTEVLSKNAEIAGMAAAALARIGSRKMLHRVLRLLKERKDAPSRLALVSALALVADLGDSRSHAIWVDSLTAILNNSSELEGCRALAAEGLANALRFCDRRTKRYRRSVDVIMRMLNDACAEVRFCSAFALGELRVRKGLQKLREVAVHDHAKCSGLAGHPGGWTVSQEALEAISAIRRER